MIDQNSQKLISFAEKAKTIWEDTKYDVVIEPVDPYWYEISQIWPNKKFISIIFDQIFSGINFGKGLKFNR